MTAPQADNTRLLQELVAGCEHLLLDFDGPVCRLFAGMPAPSIAANLVALLPPALRSHVRSTDPHEVLRLVHTAAPEHEPAIERALGAYEVEAATTAIPTPHAHQLITRSRRTGRTVSIVTNNSEGAVDVYLDLHSLGPHISAVASRVAGDVPGMKPDPALVRQALARVQAEPTSAILVGNSESDIAAALAAGVEALGYADRPGKRRALSQARLVIDSLAGLVVAL